MNAEEDMEELEISHMTGILVFVKNLASFLYLLKKMCFFFFLPEQTSSCVLIWWNENLCPPNIFVNVYNHYIPTRPKL